MKKIICIIMAIIFVLIPLSSCDSAGADGESQASESTESNGQNLQSLSNEQSAVHNEAISIVNNLLERIGNITLHVMSTADIEVDKTKTIPDNSDYCLITDEALKDCHNIDDLKAYVEKAYTNDYAEKYIYPTYLYKGDDGKARFVEYEGNLYVNQATASTVPGSIAEIDYDTLYVVSYNENKDTLQIKYDEYIPDYTEQGRGDEWSGTYCLTLVRENDAWLLDKVGILLSEGEFKFNTDTELLTEPISEPDPNLISRDEAVEIVKNLSVHRGAVQSFFISTAEIRVDETQTLPTDSDYVLITDEALKDCHSIEDLKAYVEKAYTNDYAEKYIYPTYLYKGDDGKARFMEYEGNLYVNQATASTMPGSIAEIDYDTLYVVSYNENKDTLQIKYDEYIPDYTEQGKGDEWSGTYCLTLVRENDAWLLDKVGILDISFEFETDCYIM